MLQNKSRSLFLQIGVLLLSLILVIGVIDAGKVPTVLKVSGKLIPSSSLTTACEEGSNFVCKLKVTYNGTQKIYISPQATSASGIATELSGGIFTNPLTIEDSSSKYITLMVGIVKGATEIVVMPPLQVKVPNPSYYDENNSLDADTLGGVGINDLNVTGGGTIYSPGAGITIGEGSIKPISVTTGGITSALIASQAITKDKLSAIGGTLDQVLAVDSTGGLYWKADATGSGSGTTYTALQNGGLSLVNNAFSIAPSGVLTTHINDNAVTSTKMANDSVTDSKTQFTNLLFGGTDQAKIFYVAGETGCPNGAVRIAKKFSGPAQAWCQYGDPQNKCGGCTCDVPPAWVSDSASPPGIGTCNCTPLRRPVVMPDGACMTNLAPCTASGNYYFSGSVCIGSP
ncbi:MAG: hypothetical protein V1824_00260 [archaeon]